MSNSNSSNKTAPYAPQKQQKKRRAWTPARRAAQALRIRVTKPWLWACGPKTAAGKARVRLNAQKHARRSAAFTIQVKILRHLLKCQRAYLKKSKLYGQSEWIKNQMARNHPLTI